MPDTAGHAMPDMAGHAIAHCKQSRAASWSVTCGIGFNLLTRTLFTAIGAEDTALARPGTQDSTARRAAIELDSNIDRHRFSLSKATHGTLNHRDEIHFIYLPQF